MPLRGDGSLAQGLQGLQGKARRPTPVGRWQTQMARSVGGWPLARPRQHVSEAWATQERGRDGGASLETNLGWACGGILASVGRLGRSGGCG